MREHSPSGDYTEGLIALADRWIADVAFPSFRDSARVERVPTVAQWFDEPDVQRFCERLDAAPALAKTLAAQGHQVTLNVVGEKDDKKMQKPPFSYFGELTSAGVRTVWANPGDLASKASGEKFDVVVDNNGKDLDSVGPVADFAVAAGASQFFFVSSAGMYKPTATPPHLEGDAVKESAGHNQVELMLASKPFKYSSFRPQYFTGYGNNKDCEEWFFDRLVRGRPVPIPGSGDQLSVVAHAERTSRR